MRASARHAPPAKPAPASAKLRGKGQPPRKTLASLAAVELHSIAHFLPLPSILAVGRCNRSLFEALQSPFAFKFAECWVRSSAMPADTEVSLNSALVRHAPSCLRVISAFRRPLDPSVCNVLPTAVHQLQSSCGRPEQWLPFLVHPIMQSLRVLNLSGENIIVSQDMMQAIVALQRLHTLALHPDRDSANTVFTMLPLAPALTNLTTRGHSPVSSELNLTSVTRCPSLVRLSLKYPNLQGGSFRELFTSAPLCSQLQELSLSADSMANVPMSDFPIVFGCLTGLNELTLKRIDHANPLLVGLSKAVALTSVSLECTTEDGSVIPSHVLPDLLVLASLLTASPTLRFSIRLVIVVGLFDDPEPASIEYLDSLVQRYMRAEELRSFASRIHVHWAA